MRLVKLLYRAPTVKTEGKSYFFYFSVGISLVKNRAGQADASTHPWDWLDAPNNKYSSKVVTRCLSAAELKEISSRYMGVLWREKSIKLEGLLAQ